jgi:hypothetical protein
MRARFRDRGNLNVTKKISNPVTDSRYVITPTEGRFVLWDNRRLEPLSKHRSVAAAERAKATHIRIDRLIAAGRQRREGAIILKI